MQIIQQFPARQGYFFYRALKDFGVGLGRFVEAADFADELESGCAQFFLCGRLTRFAEHFDAAAHSPMIAK